MGVLHALQRQWSKLWPSLCLICQRWPSEPLCDDCVSTFAQPRPRCSSCAAVIANDSPGCNVCHNPYCTDDADTAVIWHLDQCDCAVDYQYPWSMCVSRFKYGAQIQLARPLALLLSLAPHVEDALDRSDWIIPIPIGSKRLAQRGFNQAEQLAHHLSKHHRHKILRYALQRLDDQAQQAGASKDQRLRNIQGVFTTNPAQQNALKGKRIVLIDDVLTTGATLNEAALTLKQAGALSVQAIVFARTPPKPA